MNAVISENVRARMLGLGMQGLGSPERHKYVWAGCHAHFYAHKWIGISFLLSIRKNIQIGPLI